MSMMNYPKRQQTLTVSCHAAPESTAQKKVFKIWQPEYAAVILHPSLGCPLIIKDPAAISLYIVANSNSIVVNKDVVFSMPLCA